MVPGLAAAGLVFSCSGDSDCAAGNPLMPSCTTMALGPLAAEPLLVFASNRDGLFEIYTMNSDGTGVTRLTNNPGIDNSPRWSPDGTKIVFSSTRPGSMRQICVMNSDGLISGR